MEELKVLVLGSTEHSKEIKSYEWDNLPKDLNVANYHKVILNLTYFQRSTRPRTPSPPRRLDLPEPEQYARLLFGQSSDHIHEVVIVGNPNAQGCAGLMWLPCYSEIAYACHKRLQLINPSYTFYMSKVRSCESVTFGSLNKAFGLTDFLKGLPGILALNQSIEPIIIIPSGEMAAFIIHLVGVQDPFPQSGPIICLPYPTEITTEEAINILIQERYGIHFKQEAPKWVGRYKLPGQLPIEAEMNAIKAEMARLEQRLSDIKEEWTLATRFNKLLFEQHDPLEKLVREALVILGCTDVTSAAKEKEDARIIDPQGRHYVVEIKGLTGNLKVDHARQLNNWNSELRFDDETWNGKQLLISNTFCLSPLEERVEPLHHNLAQTIKRLGQCILPTTQLFEAVRQQQAGTFDQEQFWDKIYSTNGLCDLPEPHRPETETE